MSEHLEVFFTQLVSVCERNQMLVTKVTCSTFQTNSVTFGTQSKAVLLTVQKTSRLLLLKDRRRNKKKRLHLISQLSRRINETRSHVWCFFSIDNTHCCKWELKHTHTHTHTRYTETGPSASHWNHTTQTQVDKQFNQKSLWLCGWIYWKDVCVILQKQI